MDYGYFSSKVFIFNNNFYFSKYILKKKMKIYNYSNIYYQDSCRMTLFFQEVEFILNKQLTDQSKVSALYNCEDDDTNR